MKSEYLKILHEIFLYFNERLNTVQKILENLLLHLLYW